MKKIQKQIAAATLLIVSVIFALGAVFLFDAPTGAHANFFDDVVDALDPTQAIDRLPGAIGTPTLPNLGDALHSPLIPIVRTDAAEQITQTSARIKGYVNPQATPDTVAYFEWGVTALIGNKTGNILVTYPASEVDKVLTGLQPGTTYYFRVTAKNGFYTRSGAMLAFTTLPKTPAITAACANGVTLTLAEAKAAKDQGKIFLSTINKDTGEGTVTNHSGCALPVSLASFTIDNPADPNYNLQTLFDSTHGVVVPNNQSQVLKVKLPPCNFQADYFYGDNAPAHGNRNDKSDYFLDSGFIVNRESDGGFACPVTSPQEASITIIKTVINNDGGTKNSGDFNYYINTTRVLAGARLIQNPGTYTVREDADAGYQASAWSGDCSANGQVTLAAGQNKVCRITNDDIAPANGFNVVCVAEPGSIAINQSITWRATASGGNGSYTYSWSGTDNLTGSGSTASQSYGVAGSKSATVSVTSNGQTVTRSCSANVVGGITTLDAVCVADRSVARYGDLVTWTANPTGGNGSYSYSWAGNDGFPNGNTNQSVPFSYYSNGTKTATVVVTSAGQTVTRSCSTAVIPPGGGTGGGGIDQPNVALVSSSMVPGSLASAYISLSQVPYTGEGDIEKVATFLLASLMWAMLAAGAFIGWKRYTAKQLLKQSHGLPPQGVILTNQDSTLYEVLEEEARNNQVLVSQDALDTIVAVSEGDAEHARVILAKVIAVKKARIAEAQALSTGTNSEEWLALHNDEVREVVFSA